MNTKLIAISLAIWTLALGGYHAFSWWTYRPLGSPTVGLSIALDQAMAREGEIITVTSTFSKNRACTGTVSWIARRINNGKVDEFLLRPVFSAVRPAIGWQTSEVRLYVDIPPGKYLVGPTVLYNCPDGDYFAEGQNGQPVEWVPLEVTAK